MNVVAALAPTLSRRERERIGRGVEGAEGVVGVGFVDLFLFLKRREGEVVVAGVHAQERRGGLAGGLGRGGGVGEQPGEPGEGVPAVSHRAAVEQRVLELQEDADLLAGVPEEPAELVRGEAEAVAGVARRQPLIDQVADDRVALIGREAVDGHGGSPGVSGSDCTLPRTAVQ